MLMQVLSLGPEQISILDEAEQAVIFQLVCIRGFQFFV